MFRLDGKIAAVTGAGSGIGRAIANTFTHAGARVFVLERDSGAGEETAADIRARGGMSTAIDCDVTSAQSVQAAFGRIDRQAPGLDILVNNAGIAHVGTVENTSAADLDRIYAVNVKGLFLCSRAAIARMKKGGGGAILNLASIASLIGLVDRFAYSMSKGAVLAMTRSIAVDFIGDKICCNCVGRLAYTRPSLTDTSGTPIRAGKRRCSSSFPAISLSVEWVLRRKLRRWCFTYARMKHRLSPDRLIQLMTECWS